MNSFENLFENGTARTSAGRLPIPHDSPYLTTYSWEKAIDYEALCQVLLRYWALVFVISALYVVGIFKLERFMQAKKPYKLDTPLVVWNLGLALFSIVCFCRVVPELVTIFSAGTGHHQFMCYPIATWSHSTAFWCYAYLFSKVVEFGDTLFIVLRKKNLIFLHWYHHAATLTCTYLMSLNFEPSMLLFIALNTFVHSFMYSYFALNAAGVKFSRTWAKALTTLQLTQLLTVYWTCLYPIWLILTKGVGGADCPRSQLVLTIVFTIGLSYIVLFGRLYYMSYVKPKSTASPGNKLD